MKKFIFGVLILVVLTASIYLMLPDKIRIDVEATNTKYSIYENGTFNLAATERVILLDGSAIMRAFSRNVSFENDSSIVIKRWAVYKQNISTYEEYVFDPTNTNIELVPVSHKTICYNCVGKILEFEYKDIYYKGEAKEITSPFVFGKNDNMKLAWQPGSYLSKVYTYKFASPKIWVRYKPTKDIEEFDIRLFDPININRCVKYDVKQTCIDDTKEMYIMVCDEVSSNGSKACVRSHSEIGCALQNKTYCIKYENFITIDGKEYGDESIGVKCSQEKGYIECDQCFFDGNCDGICQSGETCIIQNQDTQIIGHNAKKYISDLR